MRLEFRPIPFLLLALAACHGTFASEPEIVPNEPAQLVVGQSATVRGTPLGIRMDAISDSRCPAQVQCVWAGEAATVVTLMGIGAARTDTLKLRGTPQTVTYGDYRITLVDVQPVPRAPQDSTIKSATLTVSTP